MSVMFNKVAVLGLGLIGSSLCHVMRREKLAGHISGHAKSEETRRIALELGMVDSVYSGNSDDCILLYA